VTEEHVPGLLGCPFRARMISGFGPRALPAAKVGLGLRPGKMPGLRGNEGGCRNEENC